MGSITRGTGSVITTIILIMLLVAALPSFLNMVADFLDRVWIYAVGGAMLFLLILAVLRYWNKHK